MATEIATGVYNLGINKTSGTITSWFIQTGQGTNEKVNLAVRNNAGMYTAIITTDETVGQNEWNFVAINERF